MSVQVRKGQSDVKLTRWVAANGVLIVTPFSWYQAPSVLKLMIDRLVCADGGNPDRTTTHGKNPEEAKALELQRDAAKAIVEAVRLVRAGRSPQTESDAEVRPK